jgi:hypothetical protein
MLVEATQALKWLGAFVLLVVNLLSNATAFAIAYYFSCNKIIVPSFFPLVAIHILANTRRSESYPVLVSSMRYNT